MNDSTEGTEPTQASVEAVPRKFGLQSVIDDAKAVLTGPMDFYRQVPTTGGYAEPVIFVVVMGVVTGLLITVFSLIGFGAVGAVAAGFAAIFFMPFAALIGSFIGSAVMFVIWKLMGSEQKFEGAYRSVAYASATYPIMAVVGLIPYIGTVIGVVWGMYLMYCASTQVHKIDQGRAKIVLGILGAVMLMFQLSGEIATRSIQANMEERMEEMGTSVEDLGKVMEKLGTSMEGVDPEEITPEEAGKAVGDFFRGMNEAIQKAEQEAKQAEPSGSASGAASTQE